MKKLNNMDWRKYDELTETVFSPLYEALAEMFLRMVNIVNGFYIDVGTGNGALVRAVVKKCVKVYACAIDISLEALKYAYKHVYSEKLSDRIDLVLCDVHSLPFRSSVADLITSRGSAYFWDDKPKAFREIYRVQKPGGISFIGGGFGSQEVKRHIMERMRVIDPDWKPKGLTRRVNFREALSEAGIDSYEILEDEANLWVILKKDS